MRILLVIAALVLGSWWSNAYADSRHPSYQRPRPGQIVDRLPEQHQVIRTNRHHYYVHRGAFYQKRGRSFVVVNAPYGARLDHLPVGYISFGIGGSRYYHFGGTYYIRANDKYEVVEPPQEASDYVRVANRALVVYPAANQTPTQQQQDRYECHRWSFTETGFDPSGEEPDYRLKPVYDRAMSACLEARNYVVR